MISFFKKKNSIKISDRFIIINDTKFPNPNSKNTINNTFLTFCEENPIYLINKNNKLGGIPLPIKEINGKMVYYK